MRVKSVRSLKPTDVPAHSVVIEDDMGNPIIAAVEVADGIMYSDIGSPDFENVLEMCGVDKSKKPSVKEIGQLKK